VVGLKRNTVILCPSNPLWIEKGMEVVQRVREACGHLASNAQHVGSTAVPGLNAKPILDIAVAIEDVSDIKAVITKMEHAGFAYRGKEGEIESFLFIEFIQGDIRTAHIHAVKSGSILWQQYIGFRNYLISNDEAAKEYGKLKEQLAMQYPNNRVEYTKNKNDFIQGILTNLNPSIKKSEGTSD